MTTIPIEHMNMPTIVIDVSRYRHKHENFYESKLSHLIVSIYAAKLNHSGLQVQRFLRYHGNEISYSNIHESSPLGRSR